MKPHLGDDVGPCLQDGSGADWGHVQALVVPQGDVASMVLAGKQAFLDWAALKVRKVLQQDFFFLLKSSP